MQGGKPYTATKNNTTKYFLFAKILVVYHEIQILLWLALEAFLAEAFLHFCHINPDTSIGILPSPFCRLFRFESRESLSSVHNCFRLDPILLQSWYRTRCWVVF
jgi:hypothetical protein